jgi:hypothetical protein
LTLSVEKEDSWVESTPSPVLLIDCLGLFKKTQVLILKKPCRWFDNTKYNPEIVPAG